MTPRSGPGWDSVGHARREDPADALVAVAEEEDAVSVVVGGAAMGAGKRLLLRQVSNRVSHRCSCSVLIVRDRLPVSGAV